LLAVKGAVGRMLKVFYVMDGHQLLPAKRRNSDHAKTRGQGFGEWL